MSTITITSNGETDTLPDGISRRGALQRGRRLAYRTGRDATITVDGTVRYEVHPLGMVKPAGSRAFVWLR